MFISWDGNEQNLEISKIIIVEISKFDKNYCISLLNILFYYFIVTDEITARHVSKANEGNSLGEIIKRKEEGMVMFCFKLQPWECQN